MFTWLSKWLKCQNVSFLFVMMPKITEIVFYLTCFILFRFEPVRVLFLQFSPTSEHILLAYGRRHGSLLKSVVIDEETTLPIYTVLEVKAFLLHVFSYSSQIQCPVVNFSFKMLLLLSWKVLC